MFNRIKPFARQLIAANPYKVTKDVRPLHMSCQLHSDEVEKAKKAATTAKTDGPTIFDKIIDKTIPADLLYEDEKCLAFYDVAPQAPVHFLVIPKKRINMIESADANDDEVRFLTLFRFHSLSISI